eukprot:CAMPEP_0194209000 /NCGR_PEP_ID=MMETSP0156-20130528/7283_1 /TAXON_ID=33649 /ORGANISM="Thalassionema nitzschioides, Strain L26-B" /LENGTH=449 /DNA_ID=CAMNT_0038936083 /DNA_START=93 /DNA_END=1442 /DNA_ORIENTATION=-
MIFRQAVLLCCYLSWITVQAKTPTSGIKTTLKTLRAGDTGGNTTVAKKKKKKRKKTKKVIQEALKEKDSAKALGDAVRSRASDWLQDDPKLLGIDSAVSSVGFAVGTSDDGGGVEAAPNSVLAHYFLKSHGGAHALQTVCSFLCVAFSIGAILVPPRDLQIVLMKRACLFAMMKHLAGLLAATGLTAQAIPRIGLSKARQWMEKLARDPVSQYAFYSAVILVWLSASTASTTEQWFRSVPVIGRHISILLMGPLLIREVISCAFVISDILLLLETSSEGKATIVWAKTCQSIVNAFMSLLITPTAWRTSSALQRQEILASLTSKTSLAMELITGLLLGIDMFMALWQFTVLNPRPSIWSVGQRIMCARLYLNFLWIRRTKIRTLGAEIRGGAVHLPMRVLDVLHEPLKSGMGIELDNSKDKKSLPANISQWTWKEKVIAGLGLDEENDK